MGFFCTTTNIRKEKQPPPPQQLQSRSPQKSRPLWGKGDRASGGRGELASNIDGLPTSPPIPITTVQLTRTNHARLYNPASKLPLSDTLTGATSPQGARLIYMCHYQLQVILATAKQEPRKSRPLLGKGDRASGGRGELASYLDCPITNAPTPTHHVNKTAPNPRGHIIPQASSPPPSPNGPTSHPKGEAKLRTAKPVQKLKAALPWGIQKSMCKTKKPSPLGEGGRREPDGRGELALKLRLPHNQPPTP